MDLEGITWMKLDKDKYSMISLLCIIKEKTNPSSLIQTTNCRLGPGQNG